MLQNVTVVYTELTVVCPALPGIVAIMASVLTKTESAWADVSLGSRAWTVYKVIQIQIILLLLLLFY